VEQREERLLVDRILAGDQKACEDFIQVHHAPIYSLLMHLCRDVHRTEDLVQETFASAWTRIGDFSGASSLRTWLYRIAYRKFLDSQWRRGLISDTASDEGIANAVAAPAGAMDAAIANEDARRLHAALGELPAKERDVVVMYYLQGMKYEEIAEVLEVPAGTLRWRKGRALEGLRRLLREKVELEVE
jgi:RNA polymerase sigma-70 factor (ECF subfamily)